MKIKYISLWNTATPEQKKEYQRRIDQAYDIICEDITEKKAVKPSKT